VAIFWGLNWQAAEASIPEFRPSGFAARPLSCPAKTHKFLSTKNALSSVRDVFEHVFMMSPV
jgi:hypothetical protein